MKKNFITLTIALLLITVIFAPMTAAYANTVGSAGHISEYVSILAHYDDDIFTWDDSAETMNQVAAWVHDIF